MLCCHSDKVHEGELKEQVIIGQYRRVRISLPIRLYFFFKPLSPVVLKGPSVVQKEYELLK